MRVHRVVTCRSVDLRLSQRCHFWLSGAGRLTLKPHTHTHAHVNSEDNKGLIVAQIKKIILKMNKKSKFFWCCKDFFFKGTRISRHTKVQAWRVQAWRALALPAAGFLSGTPWVGFSCPCRKWRRGFRQCWMTWRGRHLCGGWLSARGSLWPTRDSPDSRSSPAHLKLLRWNQFYRGLVPSIMLASVGQYIKHVVQWLKSRRFKSSSILVCHCILVKTLEPCCLIQTLVDVRGSLARLFDTDWLPGFC